MQTQQAQAQGFNMARTATRKGYIYSVTQNGKEVLTRTTARDYTHVVIWESQYQGNNTSETHTASFASRLDLAQQAQRQLRPELKAVIVALTATQEAPAPKREPKAQLGFDFYTERPIVVDDKAVGEAQIAYNQAQDVLQKARNGRVDGKYADLRTDEMYAASSAAFMALQLERWGLKVGQLVRLRMTYAGVINPVFVLEIGGKRNDYILRLMKAPGQPSNRTANAYTMQVELRDEAARILEEPGAQAPVDAQEEPAGFTDTTIEAVDDTELRASIKAVGEAAQVSGSLAPNGNIIKASQEEPKVVSQAWIDESGPVAAKAFAQLKGAFTGAPLYEVGEVFTKHVQALADHEAKITRLVAAWPAIGERAHSVPKERLDWLTRHILEGRDPERLLSLAMLQEANFAEDMALSVGRPGTPEPLHVVGSQIAAELMDLGLGLGVIGAHSAGYIIREAIATNRPLGETYEAARVGAGIIAQEAARTGRSSSALQRWEEYIAANYKDRLTNALLHLMTNLNAFNFIKPVSRLAQAGRAFNNNRDSQDALNKLLDAGAQAAALLGKKNLKSMSPATKESVELALRLWSEAVMSTPVAEGRDDAQESPETELPWPQNSYLIAARKLTEAGEYLQSRGMLMPTVERPLNVLERLNNLLYFFKGDLRPLEERTKELMEAGQQLWIALLGHDRHRTYWAKEHDAWQAAYNVYLIPSKKPRKFEPKLDGINELYQAFVAASRKAEAAAAPATGVHLGNATKAQEAQEEAVRRAILYHEALFGVRVGSKVEIEIHGGRCHAFVVADKKGKLGFVRVMGAGVEAKTVHYFTPVDSQIKEAVILEAPQF